MSNAPKYRKKAVEYEQLKQFDRAVASYVRAIEENENAGEEVDVALFNKVGDLTLRQGRVTEAVTYYERAVEHYVSNSLYDNAIALCNKILRNAPGRSNVYFTLGRICGHKGLRTDATRNFLEYAKRVQQEGRVDEGMRALAEVADLMPELTEVRRLVEEHAARAGISLPPRRRNTPVRAPVQTDAEPVRSFGLSKDLVFLQIDYDAVKAAREKTPPPQRTVALDMTDVASAPFMTNAIPAPQSVSDAPTATDIPSPHKSSARLEDLMIFDPDNDAEVLADEAPDSAIVDATPILTPYAELTTPVSLDDGLQATEMEAASHGSDADASAETVADLPERDVEQATGAEETRENAPVVVAAFATQRNLLAVLEPEYVLPLQDGTVENVQELFIEPQAQGDGHDRVVDVETVLDFDSMLEVVPNDVASVADLQPEEFTTVNDELAARRFMRTDEELTAELVDAFESPDELPPLIFPMPSDVAYSDELVDLRSDVAFSDGSSDARVDGFEASPTGEIPLGDSWADDVADLAVPLEFVELDELTAVGDALEVQDAAAIPDSNIVFLDIPDFDAPSFDPIELDILEVPGSVGNIPFDVLEETVPSDAVALELLTDDFGAVVTPPDDLDDLFGATDIPTAVIAAEATLEVSSRCSELRKASDAEPADFALRRRLGEALLEAGNRDEAILELGAALAVAELAGALADAADIADELVHVARDDVAHHQKRLELAIRLGDQTRLRDAYLDLADNLVRRGEDLRAKAVYARVLEIDPWDDRARTALGDAAPPAPPRPPVAGSDDGHVSLADWLRDDDEPLSTRLRMREPDISGDEQDDFNALLKHFKEGVARSLGGDDHESHYDLGVAYKEMGLLDDAVSEFQMALRSRSNRLAAYEALGQCFIEQQSYKVAVTVLSRALHEPAFQEEQRVGILYLLGFSCEVLQRFDEARSYFQRVYATDINFRDVGQRLADLERTVR